MNIITHIVAFIVGSGFGFVMMAIFAAGGRADEQSGIK